MSKESNTGMSSYPSESPGERMKRAEVAKELEATMGGVMTILALSALATGQLGVAIPAGIIATLFFNRARQNSRKLSNIENGGYQEVRGLRRIIKP